MKLSEILKRVEILESDSVEQRAQILRLEKIVLGEIDVDATIDAAVEAGAVEIVEPEIDADKAEVEAIVDDYCKPDA